MARNSKFLVLLVLLGLHGLLCGRRDSRFLPTPAATGTGALTVPQLQIVGLRGFPLSWQSFRSHCLAFTIDFTEGRRRSPSVRVRTPYYGHSGSRDTTDPPTKLDKSSEGRTEDDGNKTDADITEIITVPMQISTQQSPQQFVRFSRVLGSGGQNYKTTRVQIVILHRKT